MKRNGKMILLAHCILNVNSKVRGLALYGGCMQGVVAPMIEEGYGLIQLPCPECTFLGMKRWGMTREQYDFPFFREHCMRIISPLINQLADSFEEGYNIAAVIGVDGSPSCGVNFTCEGFSGGEIATPGICQRAAISLKMVPLKGVFMDVFKRVLEEKGMKNIPFIGVDESKLEGASWKSLKAKLNIE